ncbi:hypothetical protein FXO38_26861 [Capsicum annuum]|nr:hypothetical protein FXO38_26861 [Capsicum annuum]
MDKPKDIFIDGLKAYLEGVTVITLSEDGEDGDDDQNFGGNIVSRHVTQGEGTSKSRASIKTPIIENLEERVFRLEKSIKDIIYFVKEERLRIAKKRSKRREMKMKDLINADKMMIPEVAVVLEKENLDKGEGEKEEEKNKEFVGEEKNRVNESAGVEKEDHDEGKQDEKDKNKKSVCVKENNEGDKEKAKEKNGGEVEKEGGEEHKEEGKNDAPDKEGIAEKENENEF